jgi:hypothetical protein
MRNRKEQWTMEAPEQNILSSFKYLLKLKLKTQVLASPRLAHKRLQTFHLDRKNACGWSI